MIGTTAALVAAGLAAAGSTAVSVIGASEASGAAQTAAQAQEEATKYAAELQAGASKDALDFQKQTYADQVAREMPWLQVGQGALAQLAAGLSPGGSLTQPFTEQFIAPNSVTEQSDPGYQFRLSEGMKALERSAAARGRVLGGGEMKAVTRYGQDYASGEYGNVYSRALQEYQQKYNIFNQNQTNSFNRLASLAGVGQTAANALNTAGTNTANNVTNNLVTTGTQLADLATQAGNARASGYVGSSNAWNNAFSNIGNTISTIPQYLMLMNILKTV